MDALVAYYLHQAGRGSKRGNSSIGPVYAIPPFIQKGRGIGNFLGGIFRFVRPLIWSGAKDLGRVTLKALGKEAMRTGGRILSDIADNTSPDIRTRDIVSKHVGQATQNLIGKLTGGGRKRKRTTSATPRKRSRQATCTCRHKKRATTRKRKKRASTRKRKKSTSTRRRKRSVAGKRRKVARKTKTNKKRRQPVSRAKNSEPTKEDIFS